jgi:hypothetical protein
MNILTLTLPAIFAAEEPEKPSTRAAEGDTVLVVLNHVKADKREQFEEALHGIGLLWWKKKVEKLGPASQQVQVRALYPTEPNEDGTFTYVLLMDPVIPGVDYSLSIQDVEEGSQEDLKMGKMFTESLSAPQKTYVLIQQ